MTLGYAFSAIPGGYGSSGVNTFATSNSGVIYQSDQGAVTSLNQISVFDPTGSGWEMSE